MPSSVSKPHHSLPLFIKSCMEGYGTSSFSAVKVSYNPPTSECKPKWRTCSYAHTCDWCWLLCGCWFFGNKGIELRLFNKAFHLAQRGKPAWFQLRPYWLIWEGRKRGGKEREKGGGDEGERKIANKSVICLTYRWGRPQTLQWIAAGFQFVLPEETR